MDAAELSHLRGTKLPDPRERPCLATCLILWCARTQCPCIKIAGHLVSVWPRPPGLMTTTRTRKMSGTSSASNRRTRIPLSRRVATMFRTARTTLPEIAGTPRFRRELLGVVLVLIALLSAYVIGRGGDEG